MLVDSASNMYILNWFSRSSVRVTVSVMTAETLAVTAAVDVAYAMRLKSAQMGTDVGLDVLTDSKQQLYIALQGYGKAAEQLIA
jgi:hypothetical protein